MRRLINMGSQEMLGVDIGSSSVKMIQFQISGESLTVSKAGMVDIPCGSNTDKHNEANTVQAVRDCYRLSDARTRLAVFSVCGPEVAIRDFSFPGLKSDEIRSAVMLEASQVCPFSVDDGAVDFQLIEHGTDRSTGVLAAATNKLVKAKMHIASAASLKNVLMDIDGLALLNCLEKCEDRELVKTTAVLNVGNNYTTLAVVGKNSVPFVRDMTFAGNEIIKRIADINDISPEQVRKLLYDGTAAEESGIDIPANMSYACENLITDVTSTLRYYNAQGKTAVIEKVLVCGGFALINGFVELLNSRLPAKAELWNPFKKIGCDDPATRELLEKKGPAMAVAAGLAMRTI
ncbi:MAG: type IV pilus assembly protein PilM [Candidatus Brocadiia bacterium]|nr:MAG: type IV pilus assembly protein PilM [Candidatus Brocadiia bacterium]